MKKKSHSKKENKSLRTFFIYTYVVLLVIVISLSIRAVYTLKHSKFDKDNITIVIVKEKKAVAVLGFNAKENTSSKLEIKKSNISEKSVGKELGIITEASIYSPSDLSSQSPQSILSKAAFRADSIKTDLTFFDIARLIFISKGISQTDNMVEEIELPANENYINKIASELFHDSGFTAENLSIQIVNATDAPGLGKRLEKAILNKGGNVISVSSPRQPESTSLIKYFGNKSYTSKKLQKILHIPSEETNNKSIADIIIIIGEDMKNTLVF